MCGVFVFVFFLAPDAVAGQGNTIKQWEGFHFNLIRTLIAVTTARKQKSKQVGDDVTAMHLSEEADALITGHESGSITLWKAESGNIVHLTDNANKSAHANAVTSIGVGKATRAQQLLLVSVDFDGAIVIWDLGYAASQANFKTNSNSRSTDSSLIRILHEAHWQEALAVLVGSWSSKSSSSSPVIVTAGNDCVVSVRDAETLRIINPYELHEEPICCLSLDQELVLSGSEDCTVHVWLWHPNMKMHSPRSVLRGHTAAITSMEVVPNPALHYSSSINTEYCNSFNNALDNSTKTAQPMLLTASQQGIVRIWLHRLVQCVQKFEQKNRMHICSMAKRLKTTSISAGLEDGSIIEFQAHDDDLVQYACLYGELKAPC
jgi:WD40 repeat protein